jgi:murein DD-endopeptidase MepM/ murein hydrolase activator NlpD
MDGADAMSPPEKRNAHAPTPLGWAEIVGLSPVRERWRQALLALRGDEDVPAARWGLSSLRMLRPRMAIPLWRGRPYLPRRVLLTNLFNHRQTPNELGWSVRRTQAEDFRGRDLTYDSHNGTDLAVPVGSTLLAAAGGVVVDVLSEFNRGGLKVIIDHGRGLMTCSAHLARALVSIGDVVRRGQPVAITGYSGLDALVTFPFGVPHVHFNVWLNGEPVDPFGRGEEGSLWRGGAPRPFDGGDDDAFERSPWSAQGVDAAIAACRTDSVRAALSAVEDPDRRGALTVTARNYYPTRFTARPPLYTEDAPREERLDLPVLAGDFDGVTFVDELGAR